MASDWQPQELTVSPDVPHTVDRRRHWRFVLAAAGLSGLAAFVYSTGIAEIGTHIATLGYAAPLIFVPYGLNALVDARALRVAIPRSSGMRRIGIIRLSMIRLAGEAINNITPTAYLGGEPIKAHLMRRHGLTASDGAAAVMVAKTALIASQIAFVVSGLIIFLSRRGETVNLIASAGLLTLLGLGVILLLVETQRRGLVTAAARLARRFAPRSTLVARIHAGAPSVDDRLATMYGSNRRAFIASTVLHFIGWTIGAGEVMLVLALLGTPVTFGDAYIIESLSGTIRAASVVLPGAVGVQEIGGAMICELVGIDAATGMALMLIKRGREIVFTLLGLLVLAHSRRQDRSR